MSGERRGFFERYTEAWNDHDPDAVAAQFAPGGTYVDPSLEAPLARDDIPEFVAETVAAFPDVGFTERRVVTAEAGEELVLVAEWTMTGTHAGSFQGIPPTGAEIRIDGADVVTVSEEGIESLVGYFDQREVIDQLGLTFPAVVGQLPTLAVGVVRGVLS